MITKTQYGLEIIHDLSIMSLYDIDVISEYLYHFLEDDLIKLIQISKNLIDASISFFHYRELYFEQNREVFNCSFPILKPIVSSRLINLN